MFRVDYYTVAVYQDGTEGDIRQYSDVWYTDLAIEAIQRKLQEVVDSIKGANKYVPVIQSINRIEGHLDR